MGYIWTYTGVEPTIPKEVPVKQYKGDELVATYASAEEAIEKLGRGLKSSLVRCLQGKRKSYLKYTWKYDD